MKKLVITNNAKIFRDTYMPSFRKLNIRCDIYGDFVFAENPHWDYRIESALSARGSLKRYTISFLLQKDVNDPNPIVLDQFQTCWLGGPECRNFYHHFRGSDYNFSSVTEVGVPYLLRLSISDLFTTELFTTAIIARYDTGLLTYYEIPHNDADILEKLSSDSEDDEDENYDPYSNNVKAGPVKKIYSSSSVVSQKKINVPEIINSQTVKNMVANPKIFLINGL